MVEELFSLILIWGIVIIVALALIVVVLVIFINGLTKHYIDAIHANERKDLKITRQNGEIEKLRYQLDDHPVGKMRETK